jgi:GTP-binding protein HflX
MRGPGESSLKPTVACSESRVKLLKERLAKLSRQRGVQRKARMRGDVLNVSLVGYTNAGKSTLFNALTHAGVYAADKLFATLDTTSRKLWMRGPEISSFPIPLVLSAICLTRWLMPFTQLLKQRPMPICYCMLSLTVPATRVTSRFIEVNKVLEEIGAAMCAAVVVWNKIDLTEGAGNRAGRIW